MKGNDFNRRISSKAFWAFGFLGLLFWFSLKLSFELYQSEDIISDGIDGWLLDYPGNPCLSNASKDWDASKDWVPSSSFSQIAKDNVVILSNTNCEYIPFALNFWKHYQQLGYENILFIAEDCPAYHKLVQTIGPLHVVPPMLLSKYDQTPYLKGVRYRDAGFRRLTHVRPLYMQFALQSGYSILWQDVDSVPIQDPFMFIPKGFDIVVADDYCHDAHFQSTYYCSCLIYMKPTQMSFKVLSSWAQALKRTKKNDDQKGFNGVLKYHRKNKKLTFTVLPRSVYPNGADYDKYNNTAAWIHANYRIGYKKKQSFLAKRGYFDDDERNVVSCE